MIPLKILFVFLICDGFIRVEGQQFKCITPEGSEGFCLNIWECSSRLKYVFSDKQNSLQTYNTLKSVCDYTNYIIKLCCPLLSIYQKNKETEKFLNNKKKNDTACNNNNKTTNINNNTTNINNNTTNNINNTNNNNNSSKTDTIITKSAPLKNNLELVEVESVTEPMVLKKDENEHTTNEIITEISVKKPINTTQPTNSTEMDNSESVEDTVTESININCKTDPTNIDDNTTENIYENDSDSEMYISSSEENKNLFVPFHMDNLIKNIMRQTELKQNADQSHAAHPDAKFSLNSDNQINNNTFIVINMNDNATIFKNNHKIESDASQDKNIKKTNTTEKISLDLFKKILCLIFGKNSGLFKPESMSDESIESPKNVESTTTVTENMGNTKNPEFTQNINNVVITENTESKENFLETESIENMESTESNLDSSYTIHEDLSSKNNDSLENSSYLNSSEIFDSSENSTQNSMEIINFTEEQIFDSTESGIKIFPGEVFNYITLPNPPNCGRNKKFIPKKGEYSWLVLLKEKKIKPTKELCRGTLITRQHIITTAYCVTTREIDSVLIRSQKISAYITLKINKIKIHEDFVPKQIENDIAIISLEERIKLAEVSPICLKVDPFLAANLTGIIAYTPGFVKEGNKNVGEPIPKAVTLISEYECVNDLYNSVEYSDIIDENVLCAKSKEGTENVCLGNEGSPLVIRGKSNGQVYYYQIGIVSEVNRCEVNDHHGIFVNINLYLNWILKNM